MPLSLLESPKTKKHLPQSRAAAIGHTRAVWGQVLKKRKAIQLDGLSKDNLGIGLLSHTKVCSIMGDEELDCRVRNGIGYTLFSMDTKEISKNI